MSAFDSSHGWESVRLSFIVNRPKEEPGFRLERQEADGRNIRYTTTSYAADRPEGERYGDNELRRQSSAVADADRRRRRTPIDLRREFERSASARCSSSSTAS